jgi:Tfp pilus assembly protein PilO
MTQSRRWVAGAAAAMVLLVVASYFLLIQPKMAQASDLRSQKVAQQQANEQLGLDIAQLKSQFASLPARQAELAVIQQQLPANANLPTLIRNLTTIATEAGVSLNSIAPSVPQPVTASAAVSTTGSASAGSTAATQGLFQIPVTIIVQGDYASSELFLQRVQTQMRRAFLVQALSIGSASGTSTGTSTGTTASAANGIAITLTGDVFVLQPTASGTGSTSAAPGTSAPATGSTN